MEKLPPVLGQNRAKDPVQERLKANKKLWNRDVSVFIDDTLNLKKLMNGWPSKFYKERSKIVSPIPADPATIIGSLAGDFQELVNRGNAIIREQIDYAKNRRQKQPKKPNAPQTPSAPENASEAESDLSQEISKGLADDQSYYLISQASNPLSRFWAKLLNPAIGGSEKARIRKYRMSLLNAALNVYRDLRHLQDNIVGSGSQSIFIASKLLDKIEDNWIFLSSGIKTLSSTIPQGVADSGGIIEPPTQIPNVKSDDIKNDPIVMKATEALQDFIENHETFRGIPKILSTAVKQIQTSLYKSTNLVEARELSERFLETYSSLVKRLVIENRTPNAKTLAEIKQAMVGNKTAQLEIVAQNFMSRWFNKTKHKLNTSDKTSAFRLDIFNKAEETRVIANSLMDSLEKGLDLEELDRNLNAAGQNLGYIRNLMKGLTSTLGGMSHSPEFMKLLEKGDLGDYGVNLDSKNKQELEKTLQRKQLRDLSKMYGR
jgi:hypothetical protein